MQLSWLSCAEELFHTCFFSAMIIAGCGILPRPLEGRPVTQKPDGRSPESDVPVQAFATTLRFQSSSCRYHTLWTPQTHWFQTLTQCRTRRPGRQVGPRRPWAAIWRLIWRVVRVNVGVFGV